MPCQAWHQARLFPSAAFLFTIVLLCALLQSNVHPCPCSIVVYIS